MSITQDIVDDYIQRLKDGDLKVAVSETPDNPSAYALRHPVGEILVQYTNSDFMEPDLSNLDYQGAPERTVPQKRRVNIQLTLVLRSLRGSHGTGQKLDAVRDCLKQFRPRHCIKQVYFVSEGFISEKQGIWQFGLNTATELWEK